MCRLELVTIDTFTRFLDTQTSFDKAVQKVEFDVAVTASTGTATKGGIGIMVGAIGLGSQGKSEAQDSSISRIKFLVPMVALNVRQEVSACVHRG